MEGAGAVIGVTGQRLRLPSPILGKLRFVPHFPVQRAVQFDVQTLQLLKGELDPLHHRRNLLVRKEVILLPGAVNDLFGVPTFVHESEGEGRLEGL
jgi:hypothetical protein